MTRRQRLIRAGWSTIGTSRVSTPEWLVGGGLITAGLVVAGIGAADTRVEAGDQSSTAYTRSLPHVLVGLSAVGAGTGELVGATHDHPVLGAVVGTLGAWVLLMTVSASVGLIRREQYALATR